MFCQEKAHTYGLTINSFIRCSEWDTNIVLNSHQKAGQRSLCEKKFNLLANLTPDEVGEMEKSTLKGKFT